MLKGKQHDSPDEYCESLSGWQRKCVLALRKAVLGAADFEESLKWGHLVYLCNGPVLLIRAEEERVYFGFWRGQRLLEIEPRLKPGGKYEMAKIEIREGESVTSAQARRLAKEAAALNLEFGNPQDAAGTAPKRKRK